ncbi:MAG: TolC family protein [Candidatus Poribacteria bacterium]|nr:TolC family protein [Candidatus Poribacteria bacterium]
MKAKIKVAIKSLTIGICTLGLGIVQAQALAQMTEITLEQAIQTALAENLELKAAHQKINVAQARLDGIALLGNPELETEVLPGEEGERSVELTKEFQLGGQRGHRKRMALAGIEKVNTEIADAQRLLIKEVKGAFYELLLTQEKIKLAKSIVQLNEQILDIAEVQFEVGEVPITEVNLAKIELQSAIREQTELENERELAQLELNGLMGTPMESPHLAKGELKYQPLRLNLDVLKTYALANRADLKALQMEGQMTQSELALAKAENTPDLGIALITRREAGETLFGGKISIPLPFFDRNRVEIGATKAQQQVNRAEVSNQERQITREVVGAYLAVNAAQKVLAFYEGGILDLLDENLELIRTAYELGEAELLEVVLTQNEFIETRFAYLDALAAYTKALVELEAAAGESLDNIPLAHVPLETNPYSVVSGQLKINTRQSSLVNRQLKKEDLK